MAESDEIVISGYQQVMQQLALERPSLQSLWSDLFQDTVGPKPKSLIEISGAPNTGKSLILWQILARCIPPTYFGGKYADVIFIDLGHKFHVRHFYNFMKCFISESCAKGVEIDCEEVAKKCLDSVIKLDCNDTEEFQLAFETVEDILWENNNVALLIIDRLDAFYWTDTCKKLVRKSTHYAKAITKLKQLCANHNICCAYTVDSNYVINKNQPTTSTVAVNISNDIRYKFRMDLLPDGTRTLNDRPITINGSKLHFK